jgi:hypothetical protein
MSLEGKPIATPDVRLEERSLVDENLNPVIPLNRSEANPGIPGSQYAVIGGAISGAGMARFLYWSRSIT